MPKEFLDPQGLQTLVNELETNIVAEEYSSSATYAVGDYCIYNNLLYRCTTATTGTWDSTAWVQVIISDEIPTIRSITTAQWEALTPAQKASGDYVITDATTVPLTAENVPYDDTVSGLTADNVQDAIDELSQSSGASSVAQLEDVQLSNLSDNDLLVYDSNLTGGKLWKNAKKIVTCTKAQFDDWSANGTFPYTDCKYIVTDVNNLNTTSADIPYDSTGTDSVKDILDSKAATSVVLTKQNDMSGGSIRNVDLNTLTETKSYWVNNEGITNAPVNTYGYLEVFKQGDSLRLQRYTVFGSYDVYERYYVNSQWYSWNKIGGPNDIFNYYGEISQSGVLSSVGTYMKNNYRGNRWVQARFKPTDSTGYWGTSSIMAMWNLSSSNYGVAILMSDNTSKNSVIYGQLAGGTWSFKTPTLTTVT